jgi:hypothetical protein
MKALGICYGASTITIVELERKIMAVNVIHVASRAHDGNPKKGVADLTAPTQKKFRTIPRKTTTCHGISRIGNPLTPVE